MFTCLCYLVLSVASQHIDPHGMNQFNPGVGVEYNGYAVGEYRNSLDRTSVYAAKMIQSGHVGVFAGAITGYPSMFGKTGLNPMLAPYVTFGDKYAVNIAIVPSPFRWNETAVAIQLKVSL